MKLPQILLQFLFVILFIQQGFSQGNINDEIQSLTVRIDSVNEIAKRNMQKDIKLAEEKFSLVISMIDSLPKDTEDLREYLKKQANAYRIIGSYSSMNNENVKALEYLEKSLQIKRDIGERESQIQNYQAISSVWGGEGDFDKAGIASDSAYRIAVETKSKKYLSEAARGRASFFRATEVFDSAHYYYKKAIEAADDAPGKVPKYAALDMYSKFLRERGQKEESLQYVNKFLEALKDNKDTVYFHQVYLTLGQTEMSLGNSQKATQYYKEAVYYAKETNQTYNIVWAYKGLAESYEASGLYAKALETSKLFIEANDRRRDTMAYRERAEVALKNEYELKKAVDSTAFAQQKIIDEGILKRKANTRFWMVVTALLVGLAAIAYFYIRNRQKVKDQAYQNILLNNKVATKTEEINELLTETISHIKSKKRIAENLQKLSKEEGDISIKSIIADLNAGKGDDAKLLLVKENIEKVNYEFIKSLKSKHPNLTKTDIEICSFIRMGLGRQEIANLRNTSVFAVKTSRQRIRKKLELTSGNSLDDYVKLL